MSSSLKVNITKKFLIFYLITISFASISFMTGLYFYYNYLIQTILKAAHNSLFISDFHSLKEIIAPLVDQNIQSVRILNSNAEVVFFHQGESKNFLIWTFHQLSSNHQYQMLISFNITYPLLILCFICTIALVIIYPISYIEKQAHDRKRKDFILSLSQKYAHDIRSPLSSLNLIASKIENSDIQEIQKAVSQTIMESSEVFLKKIKEYAVNPDFKMDLDGDSNSSITFSEILNILKNEFEAKRLNQNLRFYCSAPAGSSMKNKNIIVPIIRNLIQNSLEATDQLKGTIDVVIQPSQILKNNIEITVSDNGKGIPEKIIKKLGKEKISYGKQAHDYSGNGIALFNAYNDLKNLGHELFIESKEGLGSRFTIRISVN